MNDPGVIRIATTYWLAVLTFAVLGGLAFSGYALAQRSTYEAQSTLLVSPASTGDKVNLGQVVDYITANMQNYYNLATSSTVTGAAVVASGSRITSQEFVRLTSQEFVRRMSVDVPTGSSMVSVTVKGRDPNETVALSRSETQALTQAIIKSAPKFGNKSILDVSVVQDAAQTLKQNRVNYALWGAIGVGVGLMLGLGATRLWWAIRRELKLTADGRRYNETDSRPNRSVPEVDRGT